MPTPTSSTTHRFIDPRPILDRAIATGGAVIAGIGSHQLTASTPCPEMDVRAMLTHLLGVLDRIAALGNNEDPFSVIEAHAPDGDWSAASFTATQAPANQVKRATPGRVLSGHPQAHASVRDASPNGFGMSPGSHLGDVDAGT